MSGGAAWLHECVVERMCDAAGGGRVGQLTPAALSLLTEDASFRLRDAVRAAARSMKRRVAAGNGADMILQPGDVAAALPSMNRGFIQLRDTTTVMRPQCSSQPDRNDMEIDVKPDLNTLNSENLAYFSSRLVDARLYGIASSVNFELPSCSKRPDVTMQFFGEGLIRRDSGNGEDSSENDEVSELASIDRKLWRISQSYHENSEDFQDLCETIRCQISCESPARLRNILRMLSFNFSERRQLTESAFCLWLVLDTALQNGACTVVRQHFLSAPIDWLKLVTDIGAAPSSCSMYILAKCVFLITRITMEPVESVAQRLHRVLSFEISIESPLTLVSAMNVARILGTKIFEHIDWLSVLRLHRRFYGLVFEDERSLRNPSHLSQHGATFAATWRELLECVLMWKIARLQKDITEIGRRPPDVFDDSVTTAAVARCSEESESINFLYSEAVDSLGELRLNPVQFGQTWPSAKVKKKFSGRIKSVLSCADDSFESHVNLWQRFHTSLRLETDSANVSDAAAASDSLEVDALSAATTPTKSSGRPFGRRPGSSGKGRGGAAWGSGGKRPPSAGGTAAQTQTKKRRRKPREPSDMFDVPRAFRGNRQQNEFIFVFHDTVAQVQHASGLPRLAAAQRELVRRAARSPSTHGTGTGLVSARPTKQRGGAGDEGVFPIGCRQMVALRDVVL